MCVKCVEKLQVFYVQLIVSNSMWWSCIYFSVGIECVTVQTKACYSMSLSDLHRYNIDVTGTVDYVCLCRSCCRIYTTPQRTGCCQESTCNRCTHPDVLCNCDTCCETYTEHTHYELLWYCAFSARDKMCHLKCDPFLGRDELSCPVCI